MKGFDYLGYHRYFLTICTFDRQRPFADVTAGRRVVDHFVRSAHDSGFEITAYCLMPDHLHALLHATRINADFRHFIRIWKQKTSFGWKQQTGVRLWQEGYYERVLRDEEGDLWVISYLALNPVAAGLVDSPEKYPLFGSSKYSIEEILKAVAELEPWRS